MTAYSADDTITVATHVFIGVSATCMAWVLFVRPATTTLGNSMVTNKYLTIYMSLFIFCILLPIIFIATKSYKNSISGEDEFYIVKIISIITTIGFMYLYLYKDSWRSILSTVILLLLAINILEASVSQIVDRNKPEIDNVIELPYINEINGCVGIILTIIVLLSIYNGKQLGSNTSGNNYYIKTNLGLFFILAYTLWNTIFKIQLVEDSATLYFVCVTLILPIVVEYTNSGDWLQTRAITLILAIMLVLGFGNGQTNILPMYNTKGFDQVKDSENPITIFFSKHDVKLTLLIFTCIFTFMSLTNVMFPSKFEEYGKNKYISSFLMKM